MKWKNILNFRTIIVLTFLLSVLTEPSFIYSTPLFNLHNAKCAICNKAIKDGEYIIIDFWKNIYHSQHDSEYLHCYSCQRLVHPGICGTSPHKHGGKILSDGRAVCNLCIKSNSLIFYPVQAENILNEVIENMRTLGVDIPNIYKIELVDKKKMAELYKKELKKGEQNPAFVSLKSSRKLWHNTQKIETKCTIYILSDLHEMYFRQCLAHELMHVWIFVNCQYNPTLALTEGTCNYISYRILQKQKMSDYRNFYIQMLEKDPDPIYGDGFRNVKKLVKKFGGLETFLQYLRFNADFPKSAKYQRR